MEDRIGSILETRSPTPFTFVLGGSLCNHLPTKSTDSFASMTGEVVHYGSSIHSLRGTTAFRPRAEWKCEHNAAEEAHRQWTPQR